MKPNAGSKLWGGRFSKDTDKAVEIFTSSIEVDARLWAVDIKISVAHARMLGHQGIIAKQDADLIVTALIEISEEIKNKKWFFNPEAEDIHGEIEKRLFEKIGEAAKRVHTARSRNDQVVTDTRLYLKEQIDFLLGDMNQLQKELVAQAQSHTQTIMPGMTHLQHAQPISLAHHLMSYFWMFQRDVERLKESIPRILSLPLGSAALAGTGFNLDRKKVAEELEFSKVAENSLDAVSDRDFIIEFLSNGSIIMMHLSRMCEELILWSTLEFNFVELGDEVTTGSSIMPQKKNPDVAELIRGRVGRLYGSLVGALTMMKGLPMSYNRDLQEDKVHLFEGLDTVTSCVKLMLLTLQKANWKAENMANALAGDFSNATDLADDLVSKGLSFRQAHEVVGNIVQNCIQKNKSLENLTLSELKTFNTLFDEASLTKIPHAQVLNARMSEGGTSPEAVRAQIEKAKSLLT